MAWRLAPLLLLLALPGCGPSPASTPEESARVFLDLLQEKEWGDACSFLDEASRVALEPAGSCEEGLEKVYAPLEMLPRTPKLSSRGGVREWEVIETGVVPERIYLRQVDDSWLVSFFPPPELRQGR